MTESQTHEHNNINHDTCKETYDEFDISHQECSSGESSTQQDTSSWGYSDAALILGGVTFTVATVYSAFSGHCVCGAGHCCSDH